MIRLGLLTTGFVSLTLALLWMAPSGPEGTNLAAEDLVSRNAASDFGSLAGGDGAVDLTAIGTLTAPAEQTLATVAEAAVAPAIAPRAETSHKSAMTPTEAAQEAMRMMSLALVQDLRAAVETPSDYALRPASDAPLDMPRIYEVQPGDSLAGIAFRFYGSTALYDTILDANTEALADPHRLQAGMILKIPET